MGLSPHDISGVFGCQEEKMAISTGAIRLKAKPCTIAAGTNSRPPLRCRTGRVKSIDVAPHSPSAEERLRCTNVGIIIMANSSRAKSLKKAALPITGPKASVIMIPESEYQPYADAIAKPVFTGNPNSRAAIAPPTSALTHTKMAIIIPRRFKRICLSDIPLLRSCKPTSSSRKINAYSLP